MTSLNTYGCTGNFLRPISTTVRPTRSLQGCVTRVLPAWRVSPKIEVPIPSRRLRKDQAKEDARKNRRVVFDFDLWADHRSSGRFLANILSIPTSQILRALLPPVGLITAFACLVGINETLVAKGLLSAMWQFPSVPLEPLSLTSFALSLLLVFRTNSAYGRFDEARKLWGLVLNRSRDICRQAVSYFPQEDLESKSTLARWGVAFAMALKCHLRNDQDLRADVKNVLSVAETELLMTADHKVLLTLQIMSELIEKARINDFHKLQMHQNVQAFVDILGGCERLIRTPLPLSYARHTSRFLLIWLLCLPMSLWMKMGWVMVPATILISMLLLGIKEIGVDIEEPFGVLPLEVIADRAKTDMIELINTQALVKNFLDTSDCAMDMNASMFCIRGMRMHATPLR